MSFRTKETTSWGFLAKEPKQWDDLIRDDRSLEQKYAEDNLEYKDAARQAICEELGFEPPFGASIWAEWSQRNSIKIFEQGVTTKDQYQTALSDRARAVVYRIMQDFPDYRHLAEKYNK